MTNVVEVDELRRVGKRVINIHNEYRIMWKPLFLLILLKWIYMYTLVSAFFYASTNFYFIVLFRDIVNKLSLE